MKHTLRLLLLPVLIFSVSIAFAQKENYNWCFGTYNGLSFNTATPSFFADSILYDSYPTAVSDPNGNLLFYTNGLNAWNRLHRVMPSGYGLILPLFSGDVLGNHPSYDVHVIHSRQAESQFYILSGASYPSMVSTSGGPLLLRENYDLRYSLVDMDLDSGLGDIVPGQKQILLDTGIDICATVVGNGSCTQWLLTHEHYTNRFKSFRFDASGLALTPVISHVGKSGKFMASRMKVSSDNKKVLYSSTSDTIKFSNQSVFQSTVYLFDFDNQTGLLSNPILLDTFVRDTFCRALEFSPDNSKVYLGISKRATLQSPQSGGLIYQFDISQSTPAQIRASKTLVMGLDNVVTMGDLQLAPDNRIYFDRPAYQQGLAAILFPNRKGVACGVQFNSIPDYSQVGNFAGFHNPIPVMKAIYRYDDLVICSLPATLTSKGNGDSYQWNTGATTPSITIQQSGTYWVRASSSCGAWRVDTFIVASPYVPIADTFSCEGIPVTLNMPADGEYKWSNGTTGLSFTATASGIYHVVATKGQCVYNDTFNVRIYPPHAVPLLPSDTVVCSANPAIQLTSRFPFDSYLWSTGATGVSIALNTPGRYWLNAPSPCGVYSDTIQVSYCPPVIDSIMLVADTLCAGQCAEVSAAVTQLPQSLQWSLPGGTPDTHSGGATALVCYPQPGTYPIQLTATNAGGSDTGSTQIVVLPQPLPAFRDTVITVRYNTRLRLPICGTAAKISWYYGDSLLCEGCAGMPIQPKYFQSSYRCVLRSGSCTDSCHYTVIVTDIPNDLGIPTAFSPNGDGLNDYFNIVTDNPNIQVAELSVYNRWGQRLYHGQQNEKGWNGMFGGQPQEAGVYFWYLRYKLIGNAAIYTRKGDITLIR